MKKLFFSLALLVFCANSYAYTVFLISPWQEQRSRPDFSISIDQSLCGPGDTSLQLSYNAIMESFVRLHTSGVAFHQQMRDLFSDIQDEICELDCPTLVLESTNLDSFRETIGHALLNPFDQSFDQGLATFLTEYAYLAAKLNFIAAQKILERARMRGKIFGYAKIDVVENYKNILAALSDQSLSALDKCVKTVLYSGLIAVDCQKLETILDLESEGPKREARARFLKVRERVLKRFEKTPSRKCPICMKSETGIFFRLPFYCDCATNPKALLRHAICQDCERLIEQCPFCRAEKL